MTIGTAQIAVETDHFVDYGLPEYSEEELLEIEKEDEAFFGPKTTAILEKRCKEIDRILGRN